MFFNFQISVSPKGAITFDEDEFKADWDGWDKMMDTAAKEEKALTKVDFESSQIKSFLNRALCLTGVCLQFVFFIQVRSTPSQTTLCPNVPRV